MSPSSGRSPLIEKIYRIYQIYDHNTFDQIQPRKVGGGEGLRERGKPTCSRDLFCSPSPLIGDLSEKGVKEE